jgi:uridine kinase
VKTDRTQRWLALGQTAPDEVVGPPGDWEDSAHVRAGCVAPVVQLIRAAHPRIFAISGPIGAGKSTIAGAVCRSLANVGMHTVSVSMDDFYLSRKERQRRDIAWRAAPGSHDLELMVQTLAAIQDGSAPLVVPRFDMSRDDRGAEETFDEAPDVVVFEGWTLGYGGEGYDRLFPYLDWHLHLDVPKDVARQRRFDRETKLREETGRAFSAEEMQRFWDEVLGPGIDAWVPACAGHADIVVRFAEDGPTCLAEPRLDDFLPAGHPSTAAPDPKVEPAAEDPPKEEPGSGPAPERTES